MHKIFRKTAFLMLYLSSFCSAETQVPLFAKEGLPHCKIDVQGQECDAFVDLGSTSTKINLKNFSNDCYRLLSGVTHFRNGISGEEKTLQKVELFNLKIDSFQIPHMVAVSKKNKIRTYKIDVENEDLQVAEDQEAKYDPIVALGLSVWKETALLLNLDQKYMAIYKIEDSYLDKVNGWLELPFEYINGCIAIELMFDNKPSLFILDTGCSINAVKSSCEKPNQLTMKKLNLEKVNIRQNFLSTGGNFYEINRFFVQEADGILGIPFFLEHPILIDFLRKKIFLANEHTT